MDYDEKVLALAKFLEVDPALIENNYSEYHTINERTVKEGKTPEQYRELADDVKFLLNDEMIENVTQAILYPDQEVTVKKEGEADKVVKLEELVYSQVKDYLEPMRERAEKRKEVLARVNAGIWRPPLTPTQEDIYLKLKEDNMYVENVLFQLIKNRDKYNFDYTDSLRRAWLGQPLSDKRKDRTVNDGEYLVFTDDEADEWEREGLESLFDDTVDVPSHLENYVDKDRWVDDQAGERGSNISGYDGIENEVEFEGTTYYIYRTN